MFLNYSVINFYWYVNATQNEMLDTKHFDTQAHCYLRLFNLKAIHSGDFKSTNLDFWPTKAFM